MWLQVQHVAGFPLTMPHKLNELIEKQQNIVKHEVCLCVITALQRLYSVMLLQPFSLVYKWVKILCFALHSSHHVALLHVFVKASLFIIKEVTSVLLRQKHLTEEVRVFTWYYLPHISDLEFSLTALPTLSQFLLMLVIFNILLVLLFRNSVSCYILCSCSKLFLHTA